MGDLSAKKGRRMQSIWGQGKALPVMGGQSRRWGRFREINVGPLGMSGFFIALMSISRLLQRYRQREQSAEIIVIYS